MSSKTRSKKRRSKPRRQSKGCLAGKLRNADWLARLRLWLLPDDGIFAGLKRHENTKWRPADLVWLALCWSWSAARHVTDAFTEAADQCRVLGVLPLSTYQGLMKALTRWTTPLMPILWSTLHERMPEIGGRFWQIDGWIPIGFDGSRSTAPRSASAEQACCAPHDGRGQTARYRKKKSKGLRRRQNERNKPQPQEPQAWITLLWHMGLRLPWMWRLGPSNSSERAHVMDMLKTEKFPDNTLLTGDAGFVGDPLWSCIVAGGHDFLVRVGANTSLLAEWRSLANTMRALRHCLRHLAETPGPGRDLLTKLREAVTDPYVRKSLKRSRYRPKNPDKKPLGDPKVRQMTADERRKLKSLQAQRSTA